MLQTLDAGVLLRGMETRLQAMAGPGVDLMIEGPPTMRRSGWIPSPSRARSRP